MADPDYSRFDCQIVDESTDPDTELNLIYESSPERQPVTELLDLRPTKLETGNPLETRPESGDIWGQNDWRGGQGQKRFHRQGRIDNAYFYGENVDVTEEGKAILAVTSEEKGDFTAPPPSSLAVAGGILFASDGDEIQRTSDLAAFTVEDPHAGEAATDVYDLVSDGSNIYAALGANGVHKRTAGVWTHYAATGAGAAHLAWLKDRLIVAGDSVTNLAARTLYEVVGGVATALFTLPAGWHFWQNGFTEVGPFIYAAAFDADGRSRIYHFGPNASGSSLELKGSSSMPHGDVAYCLTEYGGIVYIGAGRYTVFGGGAPVLYAGVPSSSGELSLLIIATHEHEQSAPSFFAVRTIFAARNSIYMGWQTSASSDKSPFTDTYRACWGVYDPARESFHRNILVPGAGLTIYSGTIFKNRIVAHCASSGLFAESDDYVDSGFLISSYADWGNAGNKYWDQEEVAYKAEEDTAIATVAYPRFDSTAEAETLTAIAGASATPTKVKRTIDVASPQLALKYTLSTDDPTKTPELHAFSVRSYPKPEENEWRLQRFIKLERKAKKNRHAEEVLTKDVKALRKQIQDLGYAVVTFKEADAVWRMRIEKIADVEATQPRYDGTKGTEPKEHYVMALTMVGTRES